jgi:hypothetical protein
MLTSLNYRDKSRGKLKARAPSHSPDWDPPYAGNMFEDGSMFGPSPSQTQAKKYARSRAAAAARIAERYDKVITNVTSF